MQTASSDSNGGQRGPCCGLTLLLLQLPLGFKPFSNICVWFLLALSASHTLHFITGSAVSRLSRRVQLASVFDDGPVQSAGL